MCLAAREPTVTIFTGGVDPSRGTASKGNTDDVNDRITACGAARTVLVHREELTSMRRVLLAILAVGLTAGGLSAVQPRASADSAPGIIDQVSLLVQSGR